MRKEGGVKETWRDVTHMWALLYDWKREGAGGAERLEKKCERRRYRLMNLHSNYYAG